MPRMFLAIALVLGTLSLSGCLKGYDAGLDPELPPQLAGLSEAVFDVLDGQSVWIGATSDDVTLHTRLFLPDLTSQPEWRSPTILVMSPYFGDDAREDPDDPSSRPTYFRYQWLIDHFVPRGYAVAFSDVRGTGDSGGCLEQTATLQRQDGHDVVEWLAGQPWSNGNVGMFGKSYDAETQQGAAITAPPSLKTIIPVASVSGQYEWNFYEGVPFTLHTLLGNAAYMQGDGLQVPRSQEGLMQYHQRPLCHPYMLSQAAHRDGDWDQYWADREFRPHVENIEASVLYVHGLQDWNVRHVAIREWFDQIPSQKRAIFGQWAHDYPEQNHWNEDWSRQDWRETVHKWYDYWLLGLENGILEELPPVQIQDSTGMWRSEPTYPPIDAIPLALTGSGDNLVFDENTTQEDPWLLRENDEEFIRDNTGLMIPSGDSAPFLEELAWTSQPFSETVHVSGWPVLEFDAKLIDGLYPDPDTETDAHFAANLWLTDADGDTRWLNAGYLSARHRDGVENPRLVPEDVTLSYTLKFHPEDTVIPAGSTLRLSLAGSDDATEPEGTMWGAEVYSLTLSLPIIERDWEAVTLPVVHGDPITS